jgi:hypothetical protein
MSMSSLDAPAPARLGDLLAEREPRLRPPALALVEPHAAPIAFAVRLERLGLLPDARRILAQALTRRQALWWGAVCTWEALRPDPTPAADAALEAVVRFVQQPDEDQRRACWDKARAVGWATLPGTLAMAAFCSTGSLSLPGQPDVPPGPGITGRLVGAAVYLAAVQREPEHYRARLKQFLYLGREIAAVPTPWLATHPAEAV